MILALEQRTRDYFEDNDHTVLEYVEAWVEDGNTLVKLATEIEEDEADAKDITAAAIARHLRSLFGEVQVKTTLDLARQRGAHMLVERRVEAIADISDKDDVPAEKLRNDMSTWLAGKWNKVEMGESKAQVNVQLNVAQLHIDAMRQREVQHAEIRVIESGEAANERSE